MALAGFEEQQAAADELQDIKQRERRQQQPASRTQRAAANRYGAKAQNFAQNSLGANASGGSAVGAGVSAALQGQSATNVAKAAGGGWAIYTAMVALLDMVTWIGFFTGLIYLDFHYIMSKLKKGQGFFVYLAGWQKVILLIANVIVIFIPFLLGAIIYIAVCGNTLGSVTSSIIHYGTLGYVQNFCSPASGNKGSDGGKGNSTGNLSDAEARKFLADHGIGVKQTNTSLQGIQQSTLDELVNFKQSCDAANGSSCNVFVTGGTEDAHAEGLCSHANGYKADIQPNAGVNKFITSTFTKSSIRSDGAPLYRSNYSTSVYADERNLPKVDPHWDILGPCSGNA